MHITGEIDQVGGGQLTAPGDAAIYLINFNGHAVLVDAGCGRALPRLMDEVRALAANLGLTGAVHFLGERRDVPDLLNAMDIFVLPSYSEGLSLALLEAMAAGKPVVATAVGGLPEVVTEGDTGLLIPPRDAGALERLLADPAWAQRLGANARVHVREHFSLDRLGREINEIYEELVEKKFGISSQS